MKIDTLLLVDFLCVATSILAPVLMLWYHGATMIALACFSVKARPFDDAVFCSFPYLSLAKRRHGSTMGGHVKRAYSPLRQPLPVKYVGAVQATPLISRCGKRRTNLDGASPSGRRRPHSQLDGGPDSLQA